MSTLAVAAVMGLVLGRFVLAGSSTDDAPSAVAAPPARSSVAAVASLQDKLRSSPDDPRLLTELGVAYLSRARETADPTFYAKASQALDRSDALAPEQALTLTAQGLLALGRHDFAQALDWGRRARQVNPESPEALGVIVDAHVEMGQYPQATAAAQEMVDRQPSLASFARVSYIREIHGDRAGSIVAMVQAVTAGAGSAADLAYVQTLLGNLHLGGGDLAEAEDAYRRAAGLQPDYGPARVGQARVAAAGGDLAAAAERLEPVVARTPFPAWAALLGDLYQALGRTDDAEAQYGLVSTIAQLNQANGVAPDVDLARFAADHAADPGRQPGEAVDLARSVLERQPTVFAEDTLAWALRQAGRADEALAHAQTAARLGTQEALIWYHKAAVEADLGMADAARADLQRAFDINPHLSVRDLPTAQALANQLGVSEPR